MEDQEILFEDLDRRLELIVENFKLQLDSLHEALQRVQNDIMDLERATSDHDRKISDIERGY